MKSQALTLFFGLIVFSTSAQSEFDKMSFLIGEWKYQAKSLTPRGNFLEEIFYTKCTYIFNETAHKDDFFTKDANGNLICYGTTIRTYDSRRGIWRMLWVESNLSITTQMTGEYKKGKFLFDGKGADERGEYLEKIEFYDLSKDQYSWKMDRSYDGGKTSMKNYFSYTATRM